MRTDRQVTGARVHAAKPDGTVAASPKCGSPEDDGTLAEASVLCIKSAGASDRQSALTESRARSCSSTSSPTPPTAPRPAHVRFSGRGAAICCARATGTARVTHELNPRAARRVPLPAGMQAAVSGAACAGGHAGYRPGLRLRERLSYPPIFSRSRAGPIAARRPQARSARARDPHPHRTGWRADRQNDLIRRQHHVR